MLARLPAERDALLRAADLIEERGLAKQIREDSKGRLCLHGAIAMAINGNANCSHNEWESSGLVAFYLLSRGEGRYIHGHGCAFWNNAPERTKEEVVSALREAALYGL